MSLPRLTVRARLTLLYTGLFAVCGGIVVAVSYILVARLEPEGQSQQAPASFLARCRSEQLSSHPNDRLLAKCNAYFQLQGARHQRDITLSHLLQYSLITVSVVIALAAVLGWFAAGRALRPVHRITAAARAASERNLSARVGSRGPHDELQELAETFDEMLDRLQIAFEGQSRFIANASHELRTPLAVMRATADVVLDNPNSTPGELRGMTLLISWPGIELPTRIAPGRAATAVLAALLAGWTSAALPFYPPSWPVLLALVALAATLLRERAGIAFAFAVPFFPLGNISLGLALLYAALAAGWLLVTWREPRATLLFVVGPLLAPIAALGLLPLAVVRVRSAPLRMLTVALGVLTAAIGAGIRHAALPLVGGPAPLGLGVAGARDPVNVAGSLVHAAGAHPALLIETCALALVALALPHARARGRWAAAGLGAGMIVLTVAAVPSAAALPLLLAAWAIAAVTALRLPAVGVPSAAS